MKRQLAGISGLIAAAFLAACSGTGPVTTGQPAVSLPAIPSISIPSIALPSIAIPSGIRSFAPDSDLEAMFPDTVGGQPLNVTSAKGEDVISAFGSTDPNELRNFISGLGASVDQVSAAFALAFLPGATAGNLTGVSLIAVRVQGVEGSRTLAGLADVTKEDVPNAQVGTATIGGKPVTAITSSDEPDQNVYLYAVGDVVFVGAGTSQHVEEVFSELP